MFGNISSIFFRHTQYLFIQNVISYDMNYARDVFRCISIYMLLVHKMLYHLGCIISTDWILSIHGGAPRAMR